MAEAQNGQDGGEEKGYVTSGRGEGRGLVILTEEGGEEVHRGTEGGVKN